MARSVSRRAFVKLAGLGAVGAAAGPVALASAAPRRTIKVGLLLSAEGHYARMGESFAEGFRLYMEHANVHAPLLTRPVVQGHGGAYSGTTDLLAAGVDVVAAQITAPMAHLIAPLFEERRVPLVVANVGGHVQLPKQRSPQILHNSLLYWQSSFALGRWAAAKLGKTAFVATSRPDSGYDTVFAFRRGFEAGGGAVVGSRITHESRHEPGLTESFADIRNARPSVVFANYSGPLAAEFRAAYLDSGLRTKLIGPTFLAEELAAPLARRAAGITTASSWTPSDAVAASQIFQAAFTNRTGRKADAFTVLGHETALLIVAAFRRGISQGRLADALAGMKIEGVRGTLRVDPTTNTVRAPLHIRRVHRLGGRGVHYANSVFEALPIVGPLPPALAVLGEEQRAAYVNEVLCA